MAKGYLLANVTVTDGERYEDYRRQVLPVVEQYGGAVPRARRRGR